MHGAKYDAFPFPDWAATAPKIVEDEKYVDRIDDWDKYASYFEGLLQEERHLDSRNTRFVNGIHYRKIYSGWES